MLDREEHILDTEKATTSFPAEELNLILADQQPNKKLSPSKLGVEFLYVNHTPEDVPEIVAALAEKDVVLLEFITPKQDRLRKEKGFNQIMSSDYDGNLAVKSANGDPDFGSDLIEQLRASGKEIKLIDVDADDPTFVDLKNAALDAQKEILGMIRESAPLSDLRASYKSCLVIESEKDRYREKVVADQLASIFKTMQENGDHRKVGVIQGATHTSSWTTLRSDEALTTTRQFIGTEGLNPQNKVLFAYFEQMIRELVRNPDHNPSDEMVNRALLEFYAGKLLPEASHATEPREWIQHLSDQEVTDALIKIAELGRNNYPLRSLGRKDARARTRDQAVKQYLEDLAKT